MRRVNVKLWFDRLISGGSFHQIVILMVATVSVFFIVGGFFVMFFGDSIKSIDEVKGHELFWRLYYFFCDPGNQMSMKDTAGVSLGARVIGFVMSTLGSIFLGGLLISTITNTIERRVDSYKGGENYYRFNNHIVIIGTDQMLYGIIDQLCERGEKQIVVMTVADVETTRASIYASLTDKKYRERIVVNYGARDSMDYLRKVRVSKAKEVYLLGDNSEFDEIESYHDSLNVRCLQMIAKLCKEDGRTNLPCNVAFEYKTTYFVFQYTDLAPEITRYIKFRPFNFYNMWAEKVFVTNRSKADDITYKPLDYRPVTSPEQDDYVHLVVIGMSKMGQAIALQAAHIAHYPNYRRRKTRITVIDRNMKAEMDEFMLKNGELFALSHYEYIDADKWAETGEKPSMPLRTEPEYGHLVDKGEDPYFIDVEWTFIKGDDGNKAVRDLLEGYVEDPHAIITVAVCLNYTHRSLRSAMHLPKEYYEKDIPILVQQRKTASIALTLNGKNLPEEQRKALLYKNIQPFGMVYDGYDLEMADFIRYYKRINAVYNHFFAKGEIPENIDDTEADRQWDNLQTSKRWSNVYAAASIPTKLRCLGIDTSDMEKACEQINRITAEQIQMLSEMEHNRWNVEKLLLGYRPVNARENAAIISDRKLKTVYRKRYIHFDIRPYKALMPDENGTPAHFYDEMIVRAIPVIARYSVNEGAASAPAD